MDNIREIPGYYYDPLKKKYFKIQASSQAPSSSAYSSQDVKRRKIREARSAAETREWQRQKPRIQRSQVLAAPLTGGFLTREQGYGGPSIAQIYAGGLVIQGQFVGHHNPANRGAMFTVTPRPELGQGISVLHMAIGACMLTLRVNTDKYNRSDGHDSPENCHEPGSSGFEEAHRFEMFGNSGKVTSLSTNGASGIAAMTWLSGSTQTGIAIVPLARFDEHSGSILEPGASIVLGPGRSRGPEVDVLSSTAAPPQSNLSFAIGTSNGIIAVDKEYAEVWYLPRVDVMSQALSKDIFAVEFLSDNHNVLLSGGRSGILNLTDLRNPISELEADTITHPSSITHIRQLDTHRIIVAGLNSHLCQYDLRFRKKDRPSSARANPNAAKALNNEASTMSIVEYPEYHNSAHIQLGFDVDVETGVIAACQEQIADTHIEPVQLFSLHGGHKLKSPVLGQSALHRSRNFAIQDFNIKCVRFVKESSSRMKSLYVMDHSLDRYAWAPLGADD